jgi:hypothetical protein
MKSLIEQFNKQQNAQEHRKLCSEYDNGGSRNIDESCVLLFNPTL